MNYPIETKADFEENSINSNRDSLIYAESEGKKSFIDPKDEVSLTQEDILKNLEDDTQDINKTKTVLKSTSHDSSLKNYSVAIKEPIEEPIAEEETYNPNPKEESSINNVQVEENQEKVRKNEVCEFFCLLSL